MMQIPKPGHTLGPPSSGNQVLSINAMPFAQTVAAEYQALETGYRNGLYKCFGRALTSYRKFLKDPGGYQELLGQDNIAGLREKPDLKTTSRLVLYYLTGARNEPERNTAGKYARVVDYLHQERIGGDSDTADYVLSVGGMNAVLKKARAREVLKAADQTLHDRDFRRGEEPDETIRPSATDLFDPEKDLSIRVWPETYAQVLGSEINIDQWFYLECRKTDTVVNDRIRIVGRLVDPPSK
jgi:hypothetical protein